MYCVKCGKETLSDATVCEACCKAAERPDRKRRAAIIAVIAAIVLVAGLAVGGFFLFSPQFTRLELTEYIKVTGTQGYNGYATLVYEIDFAGIAEELRFEEQRDIRKLRRLIKKGEVDLPNDALDVRAAASIHDLDLDEIEELFEVVTLEVRNNGAFKNGDEAVLTIEVDEDADFRKTLVGGEITYAVKDLKEVVTVDLFDEATVAFYGGEGNGTTVIDQHGTELWQQYVAYTADKTGELSNGDTVTVTATMNNYDYCLRKMLADGYFLPRTAKKSYTVSGLNAYTQADDITDEVITSALAYVRSIYGDAASGTLDAVYYAQLTDYAIYAPVKNRLILAFSRLESGYMKNYLISVNNLTVDESGMTVIGVQCELVYTQYDATEADLRSWINNRYSNYFNITKVQ